MGDLRLAMTSCLLVLHELYAGNLVKIHQLVPSLLMAAQSTDLSKYRFGIPVVHKAVIMTLTATLIGLWLYHGNDENPAEVVTADKPATSEKLEVPAVIVKKQAEYAPAQRGR